MTAGPNPVNSHYMHLWLGAFNSASNPTGAHVRVRIEYNITFKSVKEFAQS